MVFVLSSRVLHVTLNLLPIAQVNKCMSTILHPDYAALELSLLASLDKECQRGMM